MAMIAGFTGTQRGMTEAQKKTLEGLMVSEGVTEFHHGDCIGADAEAHDIARKILAEVEIHPPTNESKRAYCKDARNVFPAKDYLARNKDIVDVSSVLFATPGEARPVLRSGTWSTIRYAAKQVGKNNKRIFVIRPCGEVIRYD